MNSCAGRFWGGLGGFLETSGVQQRSGPPQPHGGVSLNLQPPPVYSFSPVTKITSKNPALHDVVQQSSCSSFAEPLGSRWNNVHMLLGQRRAFILRGALGSRQSPLARHIDYSGLSAHKWPFRFLRLGLRRVLYTKPNDLNYSLSMLTIRNRTISILLSSIHKTAWAGFWIHFKGMSSWCPP